LVFLGRIFAVLPDHINGTYPEARLVGTVLRGFLLMGEQLLIVFSRQLIAQVSMLVL
jgi:hypothetical protein